MRPINNSLKYEMLAQQWTKVLNVKTINHWSLKRTIDLYDPKHEQEYLTYRFDVLHQWYMQNLDDHYLLSAQLIRFINILNLQDYLNAYEINFIMDINSQQFTLKRNLKSLVVDFELNKHECAYFHYRKIAVALPFEDKITKDVDLYLTTNRIVFTHSSNVISFHLEHVEKICFNQEQFSFTYFKQQYTFITSKASLILVSFQRLFKELKQEFKYES